MTSAFPPPRRHAACLAAAAVALALAGCGSERTKSDVKAAEGTSANRTATSAAAPATTGAAPAVAPRSGPWSPTGYALNGAEPFWGGTLTGTKLRYMTPEDQFGDVVTVTSAYRAGEEVYSGSYGGAPFVLTLTPGPCTLGASDHRYAFGAALRVRGETRRGCADPQ